MVTTEKENINVDNAILKQAIDEAEKTILGNIASWPVSITGLANEIRGYVKNIYPNNLIRNQLKRLLELGIIESQVVEERGYRRWVISQEDASLAIAFFVVDSSIRKVTRDRTINLHRTAQQTVAALQPDDKAQRINLDRIPKKVSNAKFPFIHTHAQTNDAASESEEITVIKYQELVSRLEQLITNLESHDLSNSLLDASIRKFNTLNPEFADRIVFSHRTIRNIQAGNKTTPDKYNRLQLESYTFFELYQAAKFVKALIEHKLKIRS